MGEETTKNRTRRRKDKKKWSTKKKVLISIAVVLLVILGTAMGGYFYIKSKIYTQLKAPITETTDDKDPNYKEVQGITNILLVGTDARTLDENSRSDSMIIATIDNNTKKIKLTSIFRDTMVDIPGYGENKINSAYELGGPELLLKTIKQHFDIKIDKYVMINFWGFEAVIDQVGGIEVDVKDYQLEELNKYIGESTGGNDCPVTKTGVQILNGKQALSYARIRHGVGDDFERTSRQQEVIHKMTEKLKKTNPINYLGIMNKMLDHIKTNVDPMEALNMAFTIYKMPSLATESLQIPIPELTDGRDYKDLGWCFLMDTKQNAKILHDFIFNNQEPDKDKFDYHSLRQALAEYRATENRYFQIYGKPSDYEESNDEKNIPDVTPETKPETKPVTPPVVEPPASTEDEEEVLPTEPEDEGALPEDGQSGVDHGNGGNGNSENGNGQNNGSGQSNTGNKPQQ